MFCVGLAAAESPCELFFEQVEHGLNAAAEVHQAKGHVVNVAMKHIRRELVLEWKQCNRREVVEHDYGQDDEDHPKSLLLHRMHGVLAGPGLPQGPENGHIAEHHEGERCEDHHREDLLKVHDVAHAFQGGINQNDEPDQEGQDCSVVAVLECGEGDGVDHSHVAVQADAGQKERRAVFDAIHEAQDVPGDVSGEEDEVNQLQGRDETKQHVQKCQMKDEDV